MRKIAELAIVILLILFTVAYTSKAMTKGNNPRSKQTVQSAKETPEKNISFKNYIKLIGLRKKELIAKLGEKATTIDDGGLEFSQLDIRVWFKNYGNGPVEQIYIDNKDIDFNGAKLGSKIGSFQSVFGKAVEERTTFAYSNFKYDGIVLSIYYDPKTETTFAAYILDENIN
ncbi:hypothetical protein LGL55_04045 [Clostridium tagluense]|uniref:hypothetical protein n=1 Tax=Clostridium TaxID=1485 RepID=UPI0013E96186|nr:MULTISPECIES: hypothetical protein [Clostridium]MBU3129218.1 hypothetical protein [Clostridium tagluense]MBW9158232.1 hypothetical protein [Clostridium tagluense]MBZ9622283.1 hypothetical protein [Clostridium sp. FP2]MCB2310293.1 hypothetical protein [Clostridium tagluense]MCB2315065.1 hypothetical protein [Clostridium tagluense]